MPDYDHDDPETPEYHEERAIALLTRDGNSLIEWKKASAHSQVAISLRLRDIALGQNRFTFTTTEFPSHTGLPIPPVTPTTQENQND